MDFRFSAEQDALRTTVRAVLAERAPMSFVRSRLDHDEPFPSELWQELAELGWTTLLVPAGHGGLGLGMVDAAVVMEECGRALFGGPFLSSAFLATRAASALGLDARVQALATGSERATVVPLDAAPVTATRRHGTAKLDGTKAMVIDAVGADWLLVPGASDEGVRSYLVEAPSAVATRGLDLTRRFGRVEFRETAAIEVGPPGDHTELWQRLGDDGAIALAAELLGVAEAANTLALDYAQAREVFGQPLSKFQVTRHKAVDLLRDIELARVGVHYAAWASDADAPDREAAVAMAKSYAAEAANHVTAECIQIHGGIGYTWECDAHLYLRRAKVDDLLLGDQAAQRRRLADLYFAAL